jgi:hypothetical protein
MADNFSGVFSGISDPGVRSEPVTPSDATPLTDVPKALYVGTGGHVALRGTGDAAPRTWKNAPSGSIIPFRAQYVLATGTTATDILAIY